MKFGIININTLGNVALIFGCSAWLSYISISNALFTSELVFVAKFFMGLFVLLTVVAIAFIIYKFRLVAIRESTIFIVYPFRFLLIGSRLDEIENLRWKSYRDKKSGFFRELAFRTKNGKTITLCDKEFENLNGIAKAINNNILAYKKFHELNIKRAETNKSSQLLTTVVSVFFFLALLFAGSQMIAWDRRKVIVFGIFLIFSVASLISNMRKTLSYSKTIKNQKRSMATLSTRVDHH